MLNVDEFESVFRAGYKKSFKFAPPEVGRILVVADVAGETLTEYEGACRKLVEPLGPDDVEWTIRGEGSWEGVQGLLDMVDEVKPDVIVTYRNLNSDAWKWSYSLGVYVNAITMGLRLPILVTPNPRAFPGLAWQHSRTDSVMVVNDSLVGDDRLVNWGAELVRDAGVLRLTHMEHDEIFARYIDAISKIPELDTDTARETLLAQLLKEPREYVASCRAALDEAGVPVTVKEHVQEGHRAADYARIIEENEVDLVVFPALEEDRIALHGAAYSLAVELVNTPLLMV
ncbi:MAG TPA: hypothetical protein RMH26_20305 [Polyangiaceae bacterium LLY-WYZ-15_(1-7)]|nr:hypothetical protein [Polyangiaceae bacterium LLY-WYZ-15_(1-7)]